MITSAMIDTKEPVRTAASLRRDVEDELLLEPSLEAEGIVVAVNEDSVVTLSGHVHSFSAKLLAERVAKRVTGVRGIANELSVLLRESARRDDADIAAAAVRALEWNVSVPAERIQVSVRDGWVTLEGDVDLRFQRDAATGAVQHLIGVKGVTNAIRVRTPVRVDADEIRARIEMALKRSAEVDARHIRVSVSDGKVSLGGAVRSWAERTDAERAAWSGLGVREVENDIVVEPRLGPV